MMIDWSAADDVGETSRSMPEHELLFDTTAFNNTNLTILTRDMRLVRCMESGVRLQTYALTSRE